MNKTRIFSIFVMLAMLVILASLSPAHAAGNSVTLQQSTATISQLQDGLYVYEAVDGITDGSSGGFNGWATFNVSSDAHTAVWETASDINAARLDFALYHTWGYSHSLGHFRLSYTTDDRSMFADGLTAGGDVTANWTELTGATVSGTGGETFTVLGDNSILVDVSGNIPATTVYSVSFEGSFTGITGIRLEALTDLSLPTDGPGLGGNGNWHLVEITLDATEPVTCPVGFYGSLSCQPAPAGTFVDTVGALEATPCPIGTYQDLKGQTSCLAAPIGFYVPDSGSVAATACPTGSTTASTASTSLADCNFPPTADAGEPYLVAVNSTIKLNGTGTDPDTNDILSYAWTSNEPGSNFDVSVSPEPMYMAGNEAGIFEVTLTVDDGQASDSDTAMVVVYDPARGFVTGGGWIMSPEGAYTPDNQDDVDVTGKANFGFVAKYKKGANVPDGNTQFQFKAGDLNFHSSSYEWLVVAGNKAQFKGEGTINGQGSYKFMITADDDNPDTFRIHIWGDTGTVYDNGAQQVLGGGSIKIHNG